MVVVSFLHGDTIVNGYDDDGEAAYPASHYDTCVATDSTIMRMNNENDDDDRNERTNLPSKKWEVGKGTKCALSAHGWIKCVVNMGLPKHPVITSY